MPSIKSTEKSDAETKSFKSQVSNNSKGAPKQVASSETPNTLESNKNQNQEPFEENISQHNSKDTNVNILGQDEANNQIPVLNENGGKEEENTLDLNKSGFNPQPIPEEGNLAESLDAEKLKFELKSVDQDEIIKKDRHVHILESHTDLEIELEKSNHSKIATLAKLMLILSREKALKRQNENPGIPEPPKQIEFDVQKMAEIRERLEKFIRWTSEEITFIDARKCRTYFCDVKANEKLILQTFTRVLNCKLRKSVFGSYMMHMNVHQSRQDGVEQLKLEMTEFDVKNEASKDKLHFHDGTMDLLKEMVATGASIQEKLLKSLLTNIRLTDAQINDVDDGLLKLTTLQILSLPGNWLTELPGKHLPRSLHFLDLYSNIFADVTSLATGPPIWLIHLGLGRNNLTDESQLHLLSENMIHLRSLSLEDNDIYDLTAVLHALRTLSHLSALTLQGNPCATSECYREAVLHRLPNLTFLDNVEVWSLDREMPPLSSSLEQLSRKGKLLATCYRVMGLPQPHAEKVHGKKVIAAFVFEVELPLLDATLRGEHVAEDDDEEDRANATEGVTSSKSVVSSKKGKKGVKDDKKDSKTEQNVQEGPGKKKGKKDVKDDKVDSKGEKDVQEGKKLEKKKGKKEKADSVGSKEKNVKEEQKVGKKNVNKNISKESMGKKKTDTEDLHHILSGITESKIDKGRKSSWFPSAPLPWSKVLQFQPIEVLPPDGDLTLLRDTFWSKVRARLVLVKTLPPEKVKKPKKPKKGEAALPPPPPPTETLLSRKTIAKFDLSLKSVAWCDRAIDFSWAMDAAGNRPATAEASTVGESLWDLIYEDRKGKAKGQKGKGKDKSKKGGKDKSVAEEWKPALLPLPSHLTVHFGVGLKRVQLPVHEIPAASGRSRTNSHVTDVTDATAGLSGEPAPQQV